MGSSHDFASEVEDQQEAILDGFRNNPDAVEMGQLTLQLEKVLDKARLTTLERSKAMKAISDLCEVTLSMTGVNSNIVGRWKDNLSDLLPTHFV